MKDIIKLFEAMRSIAIIAVVAVIGFSFAACGGGGGDGTPPTITTEELRDGTVDAAYSETLLATGDTPITWSITVGALPGGLTLGSTTGVIAGMPTAAGTFNFTVRAVNAAGNDTQQLTITIEPADVGGDDDELPATYHGTWVSTIGTYQPYTLTISANTIRVEDKDGDYVQYANVQFTPAANTNSTHRTQHPNGYTFTGTRTGSAYSSSNLGFIALSADGQSVYLGVDASTASTISSGAIFTKAAGPVVLPTAYHGTWLSTIGSYQPYTLTISANTIRWEDKDGDYVQYANVQFTPATNTNSTYSTTHPNGYTFTGTKTNSQYASNTIGFIALSADGKTVYVGTNAATIFDPSSSGGIYAKVALTITTTSLPDGTVGEEYNGAFTAEGDEPITWSLVLGDHDFPDGLDFESDGVIFGTPTEAKTFYFTIKATNAEGSETKGLSITIFPALTDFYGAWISKTGANQPYPLTISDNTIRWEDKNGDFIQYANVQFTAAVNTNSSNSASATYPLGYTFTGTRTDSGYAGTNFGFIALSTNGKTVYLGASASTPFTGASGVAFNEMVAPMSINATALSGGKEGFAYSKTLTATGDAPITWSIGSGALPTALTLDPATGVISGTPTEASVGTANFTITATNAAGSKTTEGLSIVIESFWDSNNTAVITNTAEWNVARAVLNGKTGAYTLTIDGDIAVAGTNSVLTFGTTASGSLSVTLNGDGKLYLSAQGTILSIGANQTLTIDSEDLKLQGLSSANNAEAVRVNAGGTLVLEDGTICDNVGQRYAVIVIGTGATFTMNGGKISDNTNTAIGSGGGVYVVDGGTFTMTDGEISGNTVSATLANSGGGGVYVEDATFTMDGGKISGNTVSGSSNSTNAGNGTGGGGVYVVDGGTFTMNDGEISGNNASGSSNNNNSGSGGGVFVYGVGSTASFTMNGGKISGNNASGTSTSSGGGGVYMYGSTFTMNDDGEISGNNAERYGGGVYIHYGSTFTMNDGKISGNTGEWGGGGVYVNNTSTFTMKNGTISGNTADDGTSSCHGGGVFVMSGTFTMEGGKISGNTANGNGGGVIVYDSTQAIFHIVNGTIYGSNEIDATLKNTATPATNGAALFKGGQATAQRGSGTPFVSKGDLNTANDTITVVNGE